jgi:hypothetical protein
LFELFFELDILWRCCGSHIEENNLHMFFQGERPCLIYLYHGILWGFALLHVKRRKNRLSRNRLGRHQTDTASKSREFGHAVSFMFSLRSLASIGRYRRFSGHDPGMTRELRKMEGMIGQFVQSEYPPNVAAPQLWGRRSKAVIGGKFETQASPNSLRHYLRSSLPCSSYKDASDWFFRSSTEQFYEERLVSKLNESGGRSQISLYQDDLRSNAKTPPR